MMEQQVNYPCETLIAFPQVDRHDRKRRREEGSYGVKIRRGGTAESRWDDCCTAPHPARGAKTVTLIANQHAAEKVAPTLRFSGW